MPLGVTLMSYSMIRVEPVMKDTASGTSSLNTDEILAAPNSFGR